MDQVWCVNGHLLPDDFHHGPEEDREPCLECGSTARRFSVSASDTASASDTVSVTVTRSTSWRTYSQNRPEAKETRSITSFTTHCEHLGGSWFVQVMNDDREELGSGVADDADDVGLLSAVIIAESLDGPNEEEH